MRPSVTQKMEFSSGEISSLEVDIIKVAKELETCVAEAD